MSIVDMTGQPRRDEEIQEALDAVTTIMLKQPLVLPLFTVHAGIIRDCLRELRENRKQIVLLQAESDRYLSQLLDLQKDCAELAERAKKRP